MGDGSGFRRFGGWTGIAFAVLVIASFFCAPAPPAADAVVSEVKAYVVDNHSGLLVQALLFGLSLPLLLFFLEAQRRRFSADGGDAPVAVVGAMAGALFYTVANMASALFAATGWLDDQVAGIGDDAFRLSFNLGYLIYLALFPLAAASLFCAAWCARRSGYRTWYSVLSGVLGVALLAGSISVVSSGLASASFPAFLGYVLWVLVSSILLLRTGAPAPEPETAAAA